MSDLIKAINEKVQDDNKISCVDAMKIAHQLNLEIKQVGQEIDKMKIKIKSCQLGCFK